MDYKQDSRQSDCWYKEVCVLDSCNSCIRYSEMKYLIDKSGIPANKQMPVELIGDTDYESFLKLAKIKDSIVDFVSKGKNLYICSRNTGNGKTSWSIKLMLKYFDEIWAGNGFRVRALFVHVPTFLFKLKNFDAPLDEEYKKNLVEVDLVVWDDLGSTYLTDYDSAQLFSYIDQRFFCGKSNIFTGNIVGEADLKEMFGSRIYSRIFGSGIVIEFKGKDRR